MLALILSWGAIAPLFASEEQIRSLPPTGTTAVVGTRHELQCVGRPAGGTAVSRVLTPARGTAIRLRNRGTVFVVVSAKITVDTRAV